MNVLDKLPDGVSPDAAPRVEEIELAQGLVQRVLLRIRQKVEAVVGVRLTNVTMPGEEAFSSVQLVIGLTFLR